jgi:hypothetical protein
MKRAWFVPSSLSLLSAVLLFTLLTIFSAAAAVIVPSLLELLRTSPRVAMLGLLVFAISPAIVVAVLHRTGHRALDGVSRESRREHVGPTIESAWAGTHAWLVLYGTSVLTSLVMLVVNPPELEPEGSSVLGAMLRMTSQVRITSAFSLYAIVWVGIAAILYELERGGRRGAAQDG